MADFNKVLLIGRLTRNPELRYISSGTAVTELSLATGRSYKRGNGEKVDETTYVDIVVWGRQAETATQYLSKGSSLLVEGRLNQDRWEDKETGKPRTKLNVVADRIQFLDSRGGNQGGDAPQGDNFSSAPRQSPATPPPAQAPQGGNPAAAAFDDNFDIEGDDIPF